MGVQRVEDEAPDRSGDRELPAFERLKTTDLGDLTYGAIKKSILTRELTTGDQIQVDSVAGQLGVSRTPVIDALRRLAAEGLVEIRARRGCYVRGLSARDVAELFQVREAIELHGVRLAMREGRHEDLARRLETAVAHMEAVTSGERFLDYDAFIEWDRAFHLAIVDSSGNARLRETYVNLHVHLHIMRAHNFRTVEPATQVNADHAAILAGLRSGDGAAAEAAVSQHLDMVGHRMTDIAIEDGRRI